MQGLAKAFGQVIRRRREAMRISQEELAHLADLHRTYIGLLERGLRSPALGAIFSIARALDVSPAKLIEETHLELDLR